MFNLPVLTTAPLGLVVFINPLPAAANETGSSIVSALMVQSVPEPAALSVFAVALILLGLMTNMKARRAVRDAAQSAKRRFAAAFTSARKMLKSGASEGT